MNERGISLVTGGCGFIGKHLVQALLDQDREVRVLDKNPEPTLFGDQAEVWKGSILDKDLLYRAMRDVSVVYHLAAIPHLWTLKATDYHEVNVLGTQYVIDAAQQADLDRFVYTSSETVLRGWRNRSIDPINESQPLPQPQELAGPYSRSKLTAERKVWQAIDQGLPGVVVYPTVPIGAGDTNLTPPTRMIRDFLDGKNPAYLECNLNLISVKAVAEGHILAAEKGKVGERFILGQENVSLSQLLQLIQRQTGIKMPKRKVGYKTALLTAKAMEYTARLTKIMPSASIEGVRLAGANAVFDCRKAKEELGLPRYSIPQALEETINWLQEQEHIK